MKYMLACLVVVLLSSCSTSQEYASRQQNRKQINKARRSLEKKVYYVQYQYAFLNNQIIIFENGAN